MKIPLTILALVALILAVVWLIAPAPDPQLLEGRNDLPWQIEPLADGSSRVFGLRLGHSTLQEAIDRFGPYQELVVFESEGGAYSLEAWFGDVQFGPLRAKVGLTLQADQSDLRGPADRAVRRKGSPTGDWKLFLRSEDHTAQLGRALAGLTYIPAYGGLEADFFRQRLGEPTAWLALEEGGMQWFYPSKGLTLLLNPDGKEVLEYVAPADFVLPPTARTEAP